MYRVLIPIFTVLLGIPITEWWNWRKEGRKVSPPVWLGLITAFILAAVGVTLASSGHAKAFGFDDWRGPATVAILVITVLSLLTASGLVASDARRPAPLLTKERSARERLTAAARYGSGVIAGLALGIGLFLVLGPTPPVPRGRPYHVYGTCASGPNSCDLFERVAPTSNSASVGKLSDGTRVFVVCQTTGQEMTNPNGIRTDTWDKLANGAYVTDLYVDTPSVGNRIPACARSATAPATVR